MDINETKYQCLRPSRNLIGPMIQPFSGPQSIYQTNHLAIASFIDGTHKQVEGVTFPFYHFVSYIPMKTKSTPSHMY